MKSLAFLLLVLGFCAVSYGTEKPPRPLIIRSLLPGELNAAKPCRVHHVALQKGIVPIEYGQPFFGTQEFYIASRKLFPNSRSKFMGGCVVQEFTDAQVLYCPQCRQAEAEWNQKKASKVQKAAKRTH